MNGITRRSLLRLGVGLPAAGAALAALSACGRSQDGGAGQAAATGETSCADPAELSASDASLRQANKYTDRAPDPTKTCSGCTFFTANSSGGVCGSCQIFVGGPVHPQGHCDSWAAKPA